MKDSDRCISAATTCGGLIGAFSFIVAVLINAVRGIDFSVFFPHALAALGIGCAAGGVFGLIGFAIVRESFAQPEPLPIPPVADVGDVGQEDEPKAETSPERPVRPRRR